MHEPITEVWRVSGGMAAANGLYDREEVAQAQHALNQSAGFKSASLERLPLATREMVAVVSAAVDFAKWRAALLAQPVMGPVDPQIKSDYWRAEFALCRAVGALDAARAAGGAHGP